MKIEDTRRTPNKTLAQIIGLSDRQIRKLHDAGIFKQTDRGKYDLQETVQAWGRYLLDGKEPSDIATERRRLIAAQAKLTELNIAEKERDLIDREEVRQTVMEALVIVGTQMDGVAGRVAGELATEDEPAVIRQRLLSETRRIREAAADGLQDYIDHK